MEDSFAVEEEDDDDDDDDEDGRGEGRSEEMSDSLTRVSPRLGESTSRESITGDSFFGIPTTAVAASANFASGRLILIHCHSILLVHFVRLFCP